MDFVQLIQHAISDPIVSSAAYTGAILLLADAATGMLKAWRSGQFQWSWTDAFVKSKVAGKYLPLLLVFIVAKATPDLPVADGVNPLATFASLGFAAFIVSEVASIKGNLDASPDVPPQGVAGSIVPTIGTFNDPIPDDGGGFQAPGEAKPPASAPQG